MYNEVEVRKAYVFFSICKCFHTRDYRFKVFLSSDYEFLSCMYGLSGASGKNTFPTRI